MISPRNPMKDQVAIVASSTTGFTAKNTSRSPGSYAVDAAIEAITAAGLRREDIDGVCGSIPDAVYMQSTLGLPTVTWYANPVVPFVNQLSAAAAAVHSGLCEVALVYHVAYRMAWNTLSALKDPFRRGMVLAGDGAAAPPESVAGGIGYTAWASRYMHEYGVPKEHFGYVAINDRSNALRNPGAAMRSPMTMDDYLSARMIRWPLCLLDMDVPVDGADAFIVTTSERARDLTDAPVLINAMSLGMVEKNVEDQQESLRHNGQHVVVEALKARGDFWIDDVDVYFPYDGFTAITLNWIENAGWCGPGEAGRFLRGALGQRDRSHPDRWADPLEPARRGVVRRCDTGLGPRT